MIAFKQKLKATKCSDHRTSKLTAHIAKIIANILRRGIERKVEDVPGCMSLDFEEGKQLGEQLEC